MATLSSLKPRFQGLLRPLAATLARAGIGADAVTLSACALSVGYGALLAATGLSRPVLLGLPAVLFARLALNALDGMLAREHAVPSLRGARLNELGDVVSDAALYLPFGLALGWPAVLTVVAGIAVEFTGLLSLAHGGLRSTRGPFGKADRAAFFGLVAVLLGAGARGPWIIATLFGVALSAAALTIRLRFQEAPRHG